MHLCGDLQTLSEQLIEKSYSKNALRCSSKQLAYLIRQQFPEVLNISQLPKPHCFSLSNVSEIHHSLSKKVLWRLTGVFKLHVSIAEVRGFWHLSFVFLDVIFYILLNYQSRA